MDRNSRIIISDNKKDFKLDPITILNLMHISTTPQKFTQIKDLMIT